MIKTYSKGYRGEREIVHTLSKKGYMVMRAPRSGRMNLALPDVVAIKKGKVLVLECKSRKGAFSIAKEQLDELKEWEEKAWATGLIAWKIPYKGWLFIRLKDVLKNKGNVGRKFAEQYGFDLKKL